MCAAASLPTGWAKHSGYDPWMCLTISRFSSQPNASLCHLLGKSFLGLVWKKKKKNPSNSRRVDNNKARRAVRVRLCKPAGEGKEERSEVWGSPGYAAGIYFVWPSCETCDGSGSGSPAAPADHIKCIVASLSSLASNKYLEGSVSVCRAALENKRGSRCRGRCWCRSLNFKIQPSVKSALIKPSDGFQ